MKNDITTIICVWRRDSLEEILERVTAQTIASDIIVWQNENCVNIDDLHNKYNFTHIHSKNHNWKFHSRFCIPLVVDTPYITILDDDVLPNPKWFEKALNFVEEKDCILGSSGRIIQPQNNYSQSIDMGENGDKQVDFVGHTWFFKRSSVFMICGDVPFLHLRVVKIYIFVRRMKYIPVEKLMLPPVLLMKKTQTTIDSNMAQINTNHRHLTLNHIYPTDAQ